MYMNLNSKENAVVMYFEQNGPIAETRLENHFTLSEEELKKILKELLAKGYLTTYGQYKTRYWRRA